eukprot:764765-Hanusia_phi.AAC.2
MSEGHECKEKRAKPSENARKKHESCNITSALVLLLPAASRGETSREVGLGPRPFKEDEKPGRAWGEEGEKPAMAEREQARRITRSMAASAGVIRAGLEVLDQWNEAKKNRGTRTCKVFFYGDDTGST